MTLRVLCAPSGQMGNAPGNAWGAARLMRGSPRMAERFTESATENRPPAGQLGGIAQVNLRDAFAMLVSFGKGEKVG